MKKILTILIILWMGNELSIQNSIAFDSHQDYQIMKDPNQRRKSFNLDAKRLLSVNNLIKFCKILVQVSGGKDMIYGGLCSTNNNNTFIEICNDDIVGHFAIVSIQVWMYRHEIDSHGNPSDELAQELSEFTHAHCTGG